jgi:hypothetical protein
MDPSSLALTKLGGNLLGWPCALHYYRAIHRIASPFPFLSLNVSVHRLFKFVNEIRHVK